MEDITVILNGYKRPEYLEEQTLSILNQSIKPKEIWLWVNECEGVKYPDKIKNIDVVVKSSRNFKYHGRFSLGLLADTKYIAFFDDDTIPGNNWFKNCISFLEKTPKCILGGAGVILNSKLYYLHERAGWPSPSDTATEVDLVGHAWFMERQLLNHMWSEIPCSFHNGEDMQLSFNAWITSGVRTFCPPHPANDQSLWSSLKAWEYGNDKKASSNGSLMPVQNFYKQRDNIISHYLAKGYVPLKVRPK